VLADQVFFLSLTWAALQVGTPAQVGLVLAAGSVPRLLILLIGGAFADQASPKRIIVGTDSGRAVVMALAAVVLMVGAMNTGGLIMVALLIGALDGLFLPAVGALPARIAPPHLMGRVAALRTVTQRVAMLVGGPLAGWLIFLYGASAAFWASAALFTVSVVALALVSTIGSAAPTSVTSSGPYPAEDPSAPTGSGPSAASVNQGEPTQASLEPGVLTRISQGLGTVRQDPVLPWLLLLIAGMNFGFAGPVTAGLPLLAASEGWGAKGAGLLLGGFGLGATVTGLGLVFVRWIPRAGRVALVSVTVMGLALACAGLAQSLVGAVVATVVLGLASGVLGTVVHAMVLTTTPQAELGRVMALVSLSIEGVVPLSFAAAGVLAGLAGPESTLFAGGGIILLTTVAAFLRPRLRSFELSRPDDPAVSAPVAPSDLAGRERAVEPAAQAKAG
jgi:MFS family permease